MLKRSLMIAGVFSLIACFALYFLVADPNGLLLHDSDLFPIGASVFSLTLLSAWLNGKWTEFKVLGGNDHPSSGPADELRESGSVKWFNASKGFGFITRDNGDDVFVHFRSIRGQGHRTLRDGQRVEFAVKRGDKGLQAEDVAVAR